VEEAAAPGRQAVVSKAHHRVQQPHDEQLAVSQPSIPVTVTTEINPQVQISPHPIGDRSANIVEELPLVTPSPLCTPNGSTASETYPLLGNYLVPVPNNHLSVDLLNDDPDQSTQARIPDTTPISIIEANQMGHDAQTWDSSQTNWQNPDVLAGHEFVGDSNTVPNEQPIIDRQMDSFFQEVDFFSMLPNGGTNDKGDFGLSGYFFNSGFSPPMDTNLLGTRSYVNEGNGSIIANNSHTIATGAVAEPYGQVQAANSVSQLPTVVYETSRKVSLPMMDNDTYTRIREDATKVMSPEQMRDFTFPNTQNLQRFLTSYFTCFDRHFPILHLASLDLRTSPSHLILSMCAIGALYRLRRKAAKDIWICARTLVKLVISFDSIFLLVSHTEISQGRRINSIGFVVTRENCCRSV
jgi:hypothetical protein